MGTDSAAGSSLRTLVERIVTGAGFDLDDLAVTPAGRRRVVRVVIDSDGGVDLDDAAEVSRRLSTAIDADDADAVMGGHAYTLEVTSRGVGRPLTLPRHFRRARTRLVSLVTTDGTAMTGHVLDASDTELHLVTAAGGDLVVPLADIARAAVEVEFSPPPATVAHRLGLAAVPDEEGRADG